jgi:hypothetical protein
LEEILSGRFRWWFLSVVVLMGVAYGVAIACCLHIVCVRVPLCHIWLHLPIYFRAWFFRPTRECNWEKSIINKDN